MLIASHIHNARNHFIAKNNCQSGGQPGTHGILQKEIIDRFSKPAKQNSELLLKMTVSNFRDIWTNMALTEFGHVKSDIR